MFWHKLKAVQTGFFSAPAPLLCKNAKEKALPLLSLIFLLPLLWSVYFLSK
jgi:hypothetical protein